MTLMSNIKWLRYALALLVALAALPTQAMPATKGAFAPPGALILFGANWCAPCRAELRTLPLLAAHAAPGSVILAWSDGAPELAGASLPANVAIADPAQLRWLTQGAAGLSAGLPFAVLADDNGAVCAVWRGGLNASRLARLKARCQHGAALHQPVNS